MSIHTNSKEHFWAVGAANHGDGFISKFAAAALVADEENSAIIRPALLKLIAKYPGFNLEQDQEEGT